MTALLTTSAIARGKEDGLAPTANLRHRDSFVVRARTVLYGVAHALHADRSRYCDCRCDFRFLKQADRGTLIVGPQQGL